MKHLLPGVSLVIVGAAVVLWCLGVRMPYPLPFAGPHKGIVTDAATGAPVEHAAVEADWWCHDNPLPDGPGHYHIVSKTQSDDGGAFELEAVNRRGGWFGTDFELKVTAPGYIGAAYVIDPSSTPLPEQAKEWPFMDVSLHPSVPSPLVILLKPARPVLLKALESESALIRQTAEEELKKIDRKPPEAR